MSHVAVIRADASVEIGTGHIQRCLTLARALRDAGWRCVFVCRSFAGHMGDAIKALDFEVVLLADRPGLSALPIDRWPAADVAEDCAQTRTVLEGLRPDLLITDHYALSEAWSTGVAHASLRRLVIDDMTTRNHQADILLNQNFGVAAADYAGRVSAQTKLLMGPAFALLRPEFSQMRVETLADRQALRGGPCRLLISMGGVDLADATSWVLNYLAGFDGRRGIAADVVMGGGAPHLAQVQQTIAAADFEAELHVNTPDMAQLMARADLAIGAMGATTWERCCLGLPSVAMIVAENQRPAGEALSRTGAMRLVALGDDGALARELGGLLNDRSNLAPMSQKAAAICDGQGAQRLVAEIGALL